MHRFEELLAVEKDIVTMATYACEKYQDKVAYSCMGKQLTFRQIDQLSNQVAAWFQSQPGIGTGDRVAIQLPNLPQYPVIVLGALKAGLVIVNTNPLYTRNELAHQLNDSEAKVLVVLANTAENAAGIIANTKVQTVIVTEVGDLLGAFNGRFVNFVLRYIKKLVPKTQFPSSLAFRAVLSEGKKYLSRAGLKQPISDGNRIAVLQYTGGTTGISKAAVLTHNNLLANTFQVTEKLGDECPGSGAIMLAPLPLYHIYAFTMNLLCGLFNGHHTVLIPNPRDLPSMIKTMEKYKINGFAGINTLYEKLSELPDLGKVDFSGLTLCSSGGMALTKKVREQWEDITGCKILEGYGLSEASPLLSCNTLADYSEGTVGKAVPGTEIKIVDINGNPLVNGLIGEVCARGPQIMHSYWRQDEETRNVLDEHGWLHTGDIGVMDDDGWLRIVDRIKDMIIVSGFNVFPNEIETHVCRHPQIIEAAAIGIQSGPSTEIIKLFVVCRDDAISVEDILLHCRDGLAPYKIPKIVEFRENLPKSNLGKVMRRLLREQLQENHD